jgi:hypothetical protein
VVHIPRDVITVLGKRGEVLDRLDLLWDEYFKTSGKTVESSDAHASSSSAPAPAPDHESTNVVQAPVPDQASSTANPNPLIGPSRVSSPSSSGDSVYSGSDNEWWYEGDGEFHGSPYTPTSSEYGLDHDLTGAHAPPPNPNPGPSTEPEHNVPVVTPPPPNLGSKEENTDSQPADPQAALYAAKGKAKESRRISGTARDVGNFGPEVVAAW